MPTHRWNQIQKHMPIHRWNQIQKHMPIHRWIKYKNICLYIGGINTKTYAYT